MKTSRDDDSSIAVKYSIPAISHLHVKPVLHADILLVVKKCIKGRKEREKHIIETGGKKERSGLDKSHSITALTSHLSPLSQLMVTFTAQTLII